VAKEKKDKDINEEVDDLKKDIDDILKNIEDTEST
jgi:hypothetical protein